MNGPDLKSSILNCGFGYSCLFILSYVAPFKKCMYEPAKNLKSNINKLSGRNCKLEKISQFIFVEINLSTENAQKKI